MERLEADDLAVTKEISRVGYREWAGVVSWLPSDKVMTARVRNAGEP